MTTTTTFPLGARVRCTRDGRTGAVDLAAAHPAIRERYSHLVPVAWDSDDASLTNPAHLELLPTLHDTLREAERTGGMVQITGPDWRATCGPLQDPADLPDDPDRPVGEVIDVVPGALVRQPAGSRRPDPADAPSSSQAGHAAYVPLRETVPPQAARDLMAGAGIDMEGFDRALAQAHREAEGAAARPALAAYDDGHAQGHRDGLLRAIRLVDQHIAKAEARDHRVLTAALVEIVGELRAEVRP